MYGGKTKDNSSRREHYDSRQFGGCLRIMTVASNDTKKPAWKQVSTSPSFHPCSAPTEPMLPTLSQMLSSATHQTCWWLSGSWQRCSKPCQASRRSSQASCLSFAFSAKRQRPIQSAWECLRKARGSALSRCDGSSMTFRWLMFNNLLASFMQVFESRELLLHQVGHDFQSQLCSDLRHALSHGIDREMLRRGPAGSVPSVQP